MKPWFCKTEGAHEDEVVRLLILAHNKGVDLQYTDLLHFDISQDKYFGVDSDGFSFRALSSDDIPPDAIELTIDEVEYFIKTGEKPMAVDEEPIAHILNEEFKPSQEEISIDEVYPAGQKECEQLPPLNKEVQVLLKDKKVLAQVIKYDTFEAFGYCAICVRTDKNGHEPVFIMPAKSYNFKPPVQKIDHSSLEGSYIDCVFKVPLNCAEFVSNNWKLAEESRWELVSIRMNHALPLKGSQLNDIPVGYDVDVLNGKGEIKCKLHEVYQINNGKIYLVNVVGILDGWEL